MYTPHTVTLYNVGREDPETYQKDVNITILRGVFLDCSKAVNVSKTGQEGADAVNLLIPFSVEAEDGANGRKKRYARPKEYALAQDKSLLWTLEPGNRCFFVKGELVEPGWDFQPINSRYDDVYQVTKVDTKDFGSEEMQHWEVGGS